MTTAVYADQFLRCALVTSDGDLGKIFSTDHILSGAGITEESERAVVSHLLSRRLVSPAQTWANGRHPLLRLTPAGLIEARRLEETARSPSARTVYLHDTLPRWVYEKAPVGGHADLNEFARSAAWWFCGSEMTWDEVDASVRYLQDKGLIEGTVRVNAGVRLTALGVDFALSTPGTALRTFMDAQKTHSIQTGDINVGPGGAVGIGSGITQTVTTTTTAAGLSGAELLEVAQVLRVNVPLLGCEPAQQDELIQDIEVLEQQAAQDVPDQAVVRTVGGRILTWLGSSAAGPVRQMLYSYVAQHLGLPAPEPTS